VNLASSHDQPYGEPTSRNSLALIPALLLRLSLAGWCHAPVSLFAALCSHAESSGKGTHFCRMSLTLSCFVL
jgi:hypothetical protein